MLFLVADDSFCDRAYRGRNPTSERYNMSYFSNNYGYGKGKGFWTTSKLCVTQQRQQGKIKRQGRIQEELLWSILGIKENVEAYAEMWSRDCPALCIEHVFDSMKTLVHEAQTILEIEQVDTVVHESLFGLKRRKEVTTTAYDKRVKSNCAVMTTAWSVMTNFA